MAKRPVVIELYRDPTRTEEDTFPTAERSATMAAIPEEVAQLPGIEIDVSYPVVTLSGAATVEGDLSLGPEAAQPELQDLLDSRHVDGGRI